MVASQRFLHGRKLNDHIAGAGLAFQHFGPAAAGEKFRLVALKSRRGGLDIFFVGLRVTGQIDPGDPICLSHEG
jgi:hypothetical protein